MTKLKAIKNTVNAVAINATQRGGAYAEEKSK